ncbi:S8 family serine peptidase [Symbioplanes lichenis]|uniref:S8 family serine peptidase n=1 Tax=Symbioplanes lichenis TaxID=1629072 RepID=UPI0027381D9C|nr:S8 family serine peptidase [Actinoplanes lichenis]
MLGRLLAGVLIGAAAIPAPAVAGPLDATPSPSQPATKSQPATTGQPAAKGQPAASSQPATKSQPAAQGTGAKTITLVTGDQVRLTPAGGKAAVAITPAPGRERITFHTFENDGGLRIVPGDVIPLLDAGRIDAELFDVEHLLAEGYGDADSATLPLIVTGAAADQRVMSTMSSIAPAKTELAAWWQRQASARTTGRTIFLDGKVKAVLDRSTAQIGAPTAWQQGLDGRGVKVAVLDTGVDATHPDLAGKIAAAANFSTSPDTVDRFGHGTHVAATVAGTGAATTTGTKRKGVAYGADLLIGKVLGDDGYGQESDIIAGMRWAVAQGAKVVNMSLGGGATDGLDPMSLAVDEISASSGALFVVAAGNDGGESTVGTPGAAPAALTVGAVDRDDKLAGFSSRGPRLGDMGLKPEITAPGVGIVAARAEGTAMGDVVDDNYTAASGTSMATPHVAGAAAILVQQHPDWSAPQIKEALISTARTATDVNVYGQGAGRTDLGRATTQQVVGTGILDFGQSDKRTGTITYRNYGAAPTTLTLARKGQITLDKAQVTVPAHGTANVTATVDTRTPGIFSGWITATATGVSVTTAVGAVVNGPIHQLTVKAIGPDGKPALVPALELRGDDSRFDTLASQGGQATYDLQEGSYIVDATIESSTSQPQNEQSWFVALPEVKVTGDMTVVLDARKTKPIVIETPKPSEQRAILNYYYHRETATGRRLSHGVMHFSAVEKVNVAATKPVTEGSFEFSSRWQLVAPLVRTNQAIDANLLGLSPSFDGTRRYPLVKEGTKDLRGKAVVVQGSWEKDESEQVAAAAEAGAQAVLLIRPADFTTWTVFDPTIEERLPIVTLVLKDDEGQRLLKKLPSTLDLTLTPSSPYLYDVLQVSAGRIPEQIVHKVTTANSKRITTTYADNGGFGWVREQRYGWRPWQDYTLDESRPVRTPSVREEWVTTGDTTWQHQVHDAYPTMMLGGALQGGFFDEPRSFKPGTASESWAAPVVRPADLGTTRTGDVLNLHVGLFVDRDGHVQAAKPSDTVTATLERNGTKLADLPTGTADVVTGKEPASYRLTVTTARSNEDWRLATRTQSVWGFSSAQGKPPHLLGIGYEPGVLGVMLKPSAKLARLEVEFSTDGGAKWRQAVMLGTTALVTPGRTPVSLRVTAKDISGNTLTQTVIDAYGR